MKILKLIFLFYLTLYAATSFAEAPPINFDNKSLRYWILQKTAFDADQLFKEIGLKVHSCQVFTKDKIFSFPSFGNCLFLAMDNSFKTHDKTQIKLWVLNAKGEYLNPLIIKWKNSQEGWFSFASEFIYLSMEDFLKYFVKSKESITPCRIDENNFLNKDLGNFLGDLEISTVSPWTLANYFPDSPDNKLFLFSKIRNANNLIFRMTSPEKVNGKRIYEAQLTLNNNYEFTRSNESLSIRMRTNYNIVAPRDSCIKGRLNIKQPKDDQLP